MFLFERDTPSGWIVLAGARARVPACGQTDRRLNRDRQKVEKKKKPRKSNLPHGLKVHFQEASWFQTRLNYVLFIGILLYSVSVWIKCKHKVGGAGD